MTVAPQDRAGRLFQRLANEADGYADRIGGDKATAYCHQIGALHSAYRGVAEELAGYTGTNSKPQPGCAFFTAVAGDATVLLEYEYEPGESAVHDLNSPMCGPGCDATVSIIQALVNCAWCDPTDVFSEYLLEIWAEQIAESEADVARDQREDHERDRYDDARDFAAAV